MVILNYHDFVYIDTHLIERVLEGAGMNQCLTVLSGNFTEHNRIVSCYPAIVFTDTSTSIESEYTEIL